MQKLTVVAIREEDRGLADIRISRADPNASAAAAPPGRSPITA
jgi:hypothetical protein